LKKIADALDLSVNELFFAWSDSDA
jgi:hypothetical protein